MGARRPALETTKVSRQGRVRRETVALDAGLGRLGVAVAEGAGGFHQGFFRLRFAANEDRFFLFGARRGVLVRLGCTIVGVARPQAAQDPDEARGRPQPRQGKRVTRSPFRRRRAGRRHTASWPTTATHPVRNRGGRSARRERLPGGSQASWVRDIRYGHHVGTSQGSIRHAGGAGKRRRKILWGGHAPPSAKRAGSVGNLGRHGARGPVRGEGWGRSKTRGPFLPLLPCRGAVSR